MVPCKKDSKKYCMACRHYEYCDRANRCNGAVSYTHLTLPTKLEV